MIALPCLLYSMDLTVLHLAVPALSAELGGALGIALFGSIGVAVYRGVMDAVPGGVPPEALEMARGTLGGAIAVAAQLPGSAGAELADAARAAFIRGVQLRASRSPCPPLGGSAARSRRAQ